jgi:hypothetical protein
MCIIIVDGSDSQLLHRQHGGQLRGSWIFRERCLGDDLDCGSETSRQILRLGGGIIPGFELGTLAPQTLWSYRTQVQQTLHAAHHPRRTPSLTQSSIAFGDYITCTPRYGANEYFANKLYLNNNLFIANLSSLKYSLPHAAKTSRFSTVSSLLKKSRLSTKEQ